MATKKTGSSSLDVYLNQWLQTATKGNVVYEHALLTGRLKFLCRKCEATQTCALPENEMAIDYVVREFVNLHAHQAGHERIPVTHMFPEALFKSIDNPVNNGLDKDPMKGKAIAEELEKYKAEMEKKLSAQEQKIKQLQQEAELKEAAKLFEAEQQKKWLNNWPSGKVIPIDSYVPDGSTWISPNSVGGGVVPNSSGTWTLPVPSGGNIGPFIIPAGGITLPTVPVPISPSVTEPKPESKPKALTPKTGRRFR